MNYDLPETIEVGGTTYAIRWDFRAAMDILAALEDPALDNAEKAEGALTILYPDFGEMPPEHYEDALKACFEFINGGKAEPEQQKKPRLVSWEQDFDLIAAPVSRVLGYDVRRREPTHWWTFLSAYMEIGDCLFAQAVAIRRKQARGEALSKDERCWYRENRALVDFKVEYTAAERDVLATWGA